MIKHNVILDEIKPYFIMPLIIN